MILFVDGIDGTGKSTLIDHLLVQMAREEAPVTLAPPLWKYLATLARAEEFAGWVRFTPGVEIAQHLLAGMCRRLDDIGSKLANGAISSDTLVLVDRGPKTVACSAWAHASTGQGPCGARDSLADDVRALEGRTTCLTASATVSAVELVHPAADLILDRVRQSEEVTPDYERYLRAFADRMTMAGPWPGLVRLALAADGDIASNVRGARAWARRSPSSAPEPGRFFPL